jgi:uncharacterized protein YecE (DUF72 family)
MQRIGTAGWSVPKGADVEGTHLQRYSRTLRCTEINSTFYRVHRASTFVRWSAETPADFRFSIKAPKTLTHEAKLLDPEPLLEGFLQQIAPLQGKMGPLLFQLPPSLHFQPAIAEEFLAVFRRLYSGEGVLEPRHESWFTPQVDQLLKEYAMARVAADPAKGAPQAAEPGGYSGFVYHRLHGSPQTYYSEYAEDFLAKLARKIKAHENAWIIFDNTALSHAYSNALRLQQLTGEI